jgi:hypothetical protein
LKRRVLRVHHLREGGFGWRWCDLCCWCRRSYVVDVLITLDLPVHAWVCDYCSVYLDVVVIIEI